MWHGWPNGSRGHGGIMRRLRPVRRRRGACWARRLRVTPINHSTVLIQTAGLNILTDPIWSHRASPFSFMGPDRHIPPGIRFEDLPPIDAVLVSHSHYDHMDLATLKRLWERDHPRIFAGLGNAGTLRAAGIGEVFETDWWQAREDHAAVGRFGSPMVCGGSGAVSKADCGHQGCAIHRAAAAWDLIIPTRAYRPGNCRAQAPPGAMRARQQTARTRATAPGDGSPGQRPVQPHRSGVADNGRWLGPRARLQRAARGGCRPNTWPTTRARTPPACRQRLLQRARPQCQLSKWHHTADGREM